MTIKEKVLDARKKFRDSKNMRLLCNTLIGEFDRISKDPTDEQCTQIIKKMIDSNKLTGNLDENKVLETFLPEQLQEEHICEILIHGEFKDLKECMKFFKENFVGRYDGKLVSSLFKKICK